MRVCVYILTYTHTHIHTHIHTYIHTYIHKYIGDKRPTSSSAKSSNKFSYLHPSQLVLAKAKPKAAGACVKATLVPKQIEVEEDLFRPLLRYSAKGSRKDMMPLCWAQREAVSGKNVSKVRFRLSV